MITCKDFVDFIRRYLDGELSEGEATEFDGHMEICPSCIDYLKSYRDTIECCEKLGDELPDDVPEALVQAILKAKKRA